MRRYGGESGDGEVAKGEQGRRNRLWLVQRVFRKALFCLTLWHRISVSSQLRNDWNGIF